MTPPPTPLPPLASIPFPTLLLQAIRDYGRTRAELQAEEERTSAALRKVVRSDWCKRKDILRLHARQTEHRLAEAVHARSRETLLGMIDRLLDTQSPDNGVVSHAESAENAETQPHAEFAESAECSSFPASPDPSFAAQPHPPFPPKADPSFAAQPHPSFTDGGTAAVRAAVVAAMLANPLDNDAIEDAACDPQPAT